MADLPSDRRDTLRILDANANRAREALRVIEDYARFVLDDRDAASAVKQTRHALQNLLAALEPQDLLAARDIVGDVGRATKTPGELERDSAEHVVRAAFARLTEAARSLSEYGKLISATAAATAEQLRYDSYELEQRIVLRGTLRRRLRDVRLYVLITETLCSRPWLETAEAAIRGGAGCLQLREKNLPDTELLRRARELRRLTRQHGVLLCLNDRPDIARLVSADAIHVGQDDLAVNDARRIAGTAVLLGKSTHTLEQFEAARAAEPDYIAVGPMFQSHTKPRAHVPGPGFLAEARKRTDLPLVAIGGITVNNAADVVRAGAACICVCEAVIAQQDPEAAARRLLSAWGCA